MKDTKFKQCVCISEASAAAFQSAANNILVQLVNPEIIMDRTRPFTMYAFYNVRRDTPETVLELLEMLDANGGNAKCEDCPAYIPSEDTRRKWGDCRRKAQPTRCDSRACELYYIERRREADRIAEDFKQIPYTTE